MTGPWLAVAVALVGGVGAGARFMVDGAVSRRVRASVPLGTLVVNVTGCLLLGLVVGLASGGALSHAWQTVLGTGLLGGYTTFSTASLEVVTIAVGAERGRETWRGHRALGRALVHAAVMLVLGMAAAGLGWWCGSSLG